MKEEADASMAKTIIKSKDWVCIVDSGASENMMGEGPLNAKQNKTLLGKSN